MRAKKFEIKIEKYLKRQFGITIDAASKRQIYEAVMSTVREELSEKKFAYEQELKKTKQKRAYYMSMEFLVGRTLRNNLFNLGLEQEVKEYLANNNFSLDEIYNIEPDPGLGNGGLGRLASCYLDALTSNDYPVTGFSILYEYGIFKQVINNGWQEEFPDYWLDLGKYGLVYRNDEEVEVRFYGYVEEKLTEKGFTVEHKNYTAIQAEPYDLLISGYKTDSVNTLRLWEAKAKTGFNMKLFEKGEYSKSSEAEAIASSISKLLYPADSTNEGKELRIKQQYFFISASLQQLIKNHYNEFGTLENLSEHVALHINDTHPAMGVPELMRLLLDEYGYSWEKAWEITTKTFAYTNHTIMSEALEKWSVDLFKPLLPRIYSIIEEINKRFCAWVLEQGKGYTLAQTAIIYDNQIRMANLSIVGSHNVNGVSKLHSDILVESTFKAFNELYPTKFGNVTNGIAHRRWLGQANPELAIYLEKLIGNDFIKDLSKINKLNNYVNDKKVIEQLMKIKKIKKEQLAEYIQNTTGITVNPNSIFDVQVKRLHEYKRQLLNALHIVYLYKEIKYNGLRPVPRTFIFAAKASSGYQMAKNIIKFIHSISQMIESDELVREYIKVVFLPDYKVILAEKIIPAADISEQISQAGKEASGTGNMKLMLNGAITLGTLDGANVEICEAVGHDNIFIFGLETSQVNDLNLRGYKSWEYYSSSPRIKETLDFIRTMTVGGMNFSFIVDYLLTQDNFMCLADFDSYVEMQEKVSKIYQDKEKWGRMSLINTANAGIFSADRAVEEYAKNIWNIKKVK
ncbi:MULTISPECIES: glycogen/starch/alpha-glucan phosphorylase [Gemella]|uniref:glycogen/starch/alpha-glucan phosphorylase n=1 Tax=Gemella TaxID=1378 RepID=UPI000767FA8D|nr:MULTISPECIES: glycogen/starch/alpha-glucan phosphorylase [Gemella]AME09420.1 alpha-glucan phosphorylase [Gemella sp. oral taxon 928]AXI27056.1 glycogen/starch/alpha-glucan phosphorylase [Gemella sp. ND 6198]